MDNLYGEYKEYKDLLAKKDILNNELLSLSGDNSEESISRINEIAKDLNDINSNLSLYNTDGLDKVRNYYKTLDDFNRISDYLKEIEKTSKKLNDEKVEVISPEGRKKKIDKSFVEEYNRLTEEKRRLRPININNYRILEGITSIKNIPEVQKEESNVERISVSADNNEIDFSVDQQIKEYEEIIDGIIKSNNLPNMGKKQIISFNDEKYSIPSKYAGRFRDAMIRLSHLNNLQNNVDTKEEEKVNEAASLNASDTILNNGFRPAGDIGVSVNGMPNNGFRPAGDIGASVNEMPNNGFRPAGDIDAPEVHRDPFKELNERFRQKNVVLKAPSDINFKEKQKVSLKKGFVNFMSKMKLKKIKNVLPYIYNLDKEIVLSYEKAKGKVLDGAILVNNKAVNFKDGAVQKFNTTKTFIKSVPRKIKEGYLKKKEVYSNAKESGGLKASMEKVYGEDKDNYMDYRIVNRVTNFKENTCQRINTAKGKIANVTKNVVTKLKAPFDKMRDTLKNDAKRNELKEKIQEVRQENLAKKIVLRNKELVQKGGYVGISIFLIFGLMFLGFIIFISITNYFS